MSFVSNIVGGILGANAAGDAANAGVTGAQKAQQLELQNQQAAQQSQAGATSANIANEQPYQQLGSQSANSLANMLKNPFTAPTLAQAEQTPGYQFNLQQGTQAIAQNAAATGNLLSGNTGTALEKYGQGLATTTYQQAYQNALNQYQTNYSDLLGGTQIGQQAVSEQGQLGQAGAQNLANVDLTGAQQQAQQINNAAAARASGYLGQAKGWGQFAGGLASGADALMGSFGDMGGGDMGGGGSLAYPNMSPGMISGAYGGPTSVATEPSAYQMPNQI